MTMRSSSLTRTLVAGSAAVIIGGAAIGVAAAQQAPASNNGTPTTQQNRFDQFINALAAKLNITPDTLKQDIQQVRQEQGLNGPRGDHGFGAFGRFGERPGMHMALGQELQVVAKTLNISVDQLRQELQGHSLADVATAHNVQPSVVADALKADVNSRIDQAVTNGKLAADRASTLKQRADARIDQLMTQTIPPRPANGPQGPRGPRSGPGSQTAPGGQNQ